MHKCPHENHQLNIALADPRQGSGGSSTPLCAGRSKLYKGLGSGSIAFSPRSIGKGHPIKKQLHPPLQHVHAYKWHTYNEQQLKMFLAPPKGNPSYPLRRVASGIFLSSLLKTAYGTHGDKTLWMHVLYCFRHKHQQSGLGQFSHFYSFLKPCKP